MGAQQRRVSEHDGEDADARVAPRPRRSARFSRRLLPRQSNRAYQQDNPDAHDSARGRTLCDSVCAAPAACALPGSTARRSETRPAARRTRRPRRGRGCPDARATALPTRRACPRSHVASTAGRHGVNASKFELRPRRTASATAAASPSPLSDSSCGGTLWNSTRRPRVSRKI